jgi:hypothetical protein
MVPLLLSVSSILALTYAIPHRFNDALAQFKIPHAEWKRHAVLLSADEEEPEMPEGWRSCGTPDDVFQVYSLKITPDPPKRSQNLRVQVTGYLAEELTTGSMNYTVKFGVIPIVQDTMELCEALKMEPKLPQCPLHGGEWDVTHEVEMPREIPFGTYTIRSTASTSDGRQIYCVEGSTTIGIFGMAESRMDDDNFQLESTEPEQIRWDKQVDFPEE